MAVIFTGKAFMFVLVPDAASSELDISSLGCQSMENFGITAQIFHLKMLNSFGNSGMLWHNIWLYLNLRSSMISGY